jgi:hypothetical protein
MGFEEAMDAIARGVEVLGIMTLVLGLAAALVRGGLALVGGQGGEEGYRIVRAVFGRSILLGTGVSCRGQHHQDRRCSAVAPDRRCPGADHAHQDVPELLAGGGDRWSLAVAARRARGGSIVAGVACIQRTSRLVS